MGNTNPEGKQMSETTADYRPMWTELGLNLEAHDLLLAAIPQLYTAAYLSQENRPEGRRHAYADTRS